MRFSGIARLLESGNWFFITALGFVSSGSTTDYFTCFIAGLRASFLLISSGCTYSIALLRPYAFLCWLLILFYARLKGCVCVSHLSLSLRLKQVNLKIHHSGGKVAILIFDQGPWYLLGKMLASLSLAAREWTELMSLLCSWLCSIESHHFRQLSFPILTFVVILGYVSNLDFLNDCALYPPIW